MSPRLGPLLKHKHPRHTSILIRHPYMMKKETIRNTMRLLRASMSWLPSTGFWFNFKPQEPLKGGRSRAVKEQQYSIVKVQSRKPVHTCTNSDQAYELYSIWWFSLKLQQVLRTQANTRIHFHSNIVVQESSESQELEYFTNKLKDFI
jgi:hypothetical protein